MSTQDVITHQPMKGESSRHQRSFPINPVALRVFPKVAILLVLGLAIFLEVQRIIDAPANEFSASQSIQDVVGSTQDVNSYSSSIRVDSEGACTSFCLDFGDSCVFGTNQDNQLEMGMLVINKRNVLKTTWEPSTSGGYARWASRYGSVTVNFAGYQMAWAGMNEAGLMLSTMSLEVTRSPIPDKRPPILGGFWMQYQLDNYSTIEQVLASDAEIRPDESLGDHYLVCDRTGACAVLEFLDGKMIAHVGTSLPVKTLTNSTYEDSLTALEDGNFWKVTVYGLDPTGPAAKAGVRTGDWITSVNGVALEGTESRDTFFDVIGQLSVGDEVSFTVIHAGETSPVTIAYKLAPLPEDLSKYHLRPGVPVQILSLGFLPQYQEDYLKRFVTAAQMLTTFNPAGSEAAIANAFDTLQAVSRDDTVWSFVFDPTNARVYFQTKDNPNVRSIDFSSLDFSCQSPVVAMDVHANLTGDISNKFTPYTHAASFAYTTTFFNQFQRVSMSPILIDTLLWGVESFPCQDDVSARQVEPTVYYPLLPPTVGWAGLTILHRVGPFWIALTVLSLAIIVWRTALEPSLSSGRRLAWILGIIILGPFGLLVYFLRQRKRYRTAQVA